MLSPEAQIKKAYSRIWGDPTVLSNPPIKRQIKLALWPCRVVLLPCLMQNLAAVWQSHTRWVPQLEQAWKQRYASGQ